MSLKHSPSRIVLQFLYEMGLGTQPEDNEEWPAYAAYTPDKPDQLITVSGTVGPKQGRLMRTGEVIVKDGIQILVRARNYPTCWEKANDIAVAVDAAYRVFLRIDRYNYLIQNISRSGPILELGREQGTERELMTLNALVTVAAQ